MPAERRRLILFRVLTACVPVAILACLELASRSLSPRDAGARKATAVHAAFNEALLSGTGLLMRPNASLDMTGLIAGCVGEVRTNALGMRMGEVSEGKPIGTRRVICLGDSVTFGWCVTEEDTYPRQLEGILRERLGGSVEVLNMGVPGATSSRGFQLAKSVLPRFAPDLVVIAYGFNDASFRRPMAVSSREVRHARELLARSSLYRALARGLAGVTARSGPSAPERGSTPVQLRYNTFTMIQTARDLGAGVVLADLDFPNGYARSVLELCAANQRVPLLRGRELLEPPQQPSADGLAQPGAQASEERKILLRVAAPGVAGQPSVAGDRAILGNLVPGLLRMHDDGRDGDEATGDSVFSLLLRLPLEPEDLDLSYAFVPPGAPGDWGAKEIPGFPVAPTFDVFFAAACGPGRTIAPVRRLGECPYRDLCVPGDPVHLNRRGARVIAEALADLVAPLIER